MHLAVVNHSDQVTAAQVQQMTRAIGHQVRYDYAPAWGAAPTEVVYYPDPTHVPPGSALIGIFRDADQPGALGYHTEEQTGSGLVIDGKVFTAVTLSNGGTPLTGPLSIASVLSHEVLELLGDPRVNAWADTGGGQLVAWELCDPVESDTYPVAVGGGAVTVSNFVLPAYFDPQSRHAGPWDHLGRLPGPFAMTRGGYMIVRKAGPEGQVTAELVTGPEFPEWKRPGKVASALARTARRLHATA